MRKLLITASLVLLLSACGSDDNAVEPVVVEPDDPVVVEPDDPVVVEPDDPVDPIIASVTLDQASSVNLDISSVDADSYAITFTLTDDDKQAITDASSFEVMYLVMPKVNTASFNMPWHNATKFSCDVDESDCTGTLVEVDAGSYTFTPSEQLVFDKATQTLEVSLTVYGALAQTKPEIIVPEMG